MRRLRILLVVVLSIGLPVSAPLPELLETAKESHEVIRVPHVRPLIRSARDVPAPPRAAVAPLTSLRREQSSGWRPPVRPASSGWVRKAPLPVPDSPAPSEDH